MFDSIPWPLILAVGVAGLVGAFFRRKDEEIQRRVKVLVTEDEAEVAAFKRSYEAHRAGLLTELAQEPATLTMRNDPGMRFALQHKDVLSAAYAQLAGDVAASERVREDATRALALLQRLPLLPRPLVDGPVADAEVLRDAAERLVAHRVLTREEVQEALEKPSAGVDVHIEDDVLAAILELLHRLGRVAEGDFEADELPPSYEALIAGFVDTTCGKLVPVALLHSTATLTVEGEEASHAHQIDFLHDGWLYRILPVTNGREYDFAAVFALLHHALDDAGVRERFEPLKLDSDHLTSVFVRPGPWRTLAKELGVESFQLERSDREEV